MPAISVLVPIYNSCQYLPACLDSLARQTFTDIEIICIDDCSTDNSLAIARSYAATDGRFQVFSQPIHQGIANIRNLLLEKASAEYIAFVDADDVVSPKYLEILYKEAVKQNADIVRCLYNLWNVQTNQQIPCEKCYKGFLRKEPDGKPINRLQAALDDTQVWLKLIRLDVIRKNQIKFLPNTLAEDISFEILLYQYAERICFLPQHLYVYRMGNPNSLSARKNLWAYGTLENLIFVAQELVKRQKTDAAMCSRIIKLLFHAMRRLRKFVFPYGYAVGPLCRKGFSTIEKILCYVSCFMRFRAYLFCWVARRVSDKQLPWVAFWMR